VPNARRFKVGHRVRLFVTSDDQDGNTPAMLGICHASVGTSSLNTIKSPRRGFSCRSCQTVSRWLQDPSVEELRAPPGICVRNRKRVYEVTS